MAAATLDRIDLRDRRSSPGEPLDAAERRDVTIADRALTIYTSGTTGLPKAANVSHHRLLQWSLWFAGLMKAGPGDRIYDDCLPLCPSVGGVGSRPARCWSAAAAVAIAAKNSRRKRFWDDICQMGLHAVPIYRRIVPAISRQRAAAPRERAASAANCPPAGNELRADIWETLQPRFRHSKDPGILCGDRGQCFAL